MFNIVVIGEASVKETVPQIIGSQEEPVQVKHIFHQWNTNGIMRAR